MNFKITIKIKNNTENLKTSLIQNVNENKFNVKMWYTL